jgi:hypothetical protein
LNSKESEQKPKTTRIVVIDGMGGGIGEELIRRLVAALEGKPNAEIIALATNAVATERMVRAGAHRGATGENAICRSASLGDFILGPIGIVFANSMLGEITPAIAEAVLAAPGKRVLIPLQNDHVTLAGLSSQPLSKMFEKAVEIIEQALGDAD